MYIKSIQIVAVWLYFHTTIKIRFLWNWNNVGDLIKKKNKKVTTIYANFDSASQNWPNFINHLFRDSFNNILASYFFQPLLMRTPHRSSPIKSSPEKKKEKSTDIPAGRLVSLAKLAARVHERFEGNTRGIGGDRTQPGFSRTWKALIPGVALFSDTRRAPRR